MPNQETPSAEVLSEILVKALQEGREAAGYGRFVGAGDIQGADALAAAIIELVIIEQTHAGSSFDYDSRYSEGFDDSYDITSMIFGWLVSHLVDTETANVLAYEITQ